MILQVTEQIEFQISYEASSNAYQAVPAELQLINVAVFTRHGERGNNVCFLKSYASQFQVQKNNSFSYCSVLIFPSNINPQVIALR